MADSVYKVIELVGEEAPGYSIEGELLGHITIGINLLDRKLQALPEVPHRKGVLLKHIILSHHGLQEWGSPKPPMTPEALVVHTRVSAANSGRHVETSYRWFVHDGRLALRVDVAPSPGWDCTSTAIATPISCPAGTGLSRGSRIRRWR